MSKRRISSMVQRYGWLVVVASLISACGGGGGGGGSGDKSGNGAQTPTVHAPYVTFSADSVNFDTDFDKPTRNVGPALVGITVFSLFDVQLFVSVEQTHVAVSGVTASPVEDRTAAILIQAVDPLRLGAGTYDDTVTIHVCYDPSCAS